MAFIIVSTNLSNYIVGYVDSYRTYGVRCIWVEMLLGSVYTLTVQWEIAELSRWNVDE